MAVQDLRTVDYDVAAASAALPLATRLGAAHLTVTDVSKSVPFYENAIGLSEQWRGRNDAEQQVVALGSDGAEPVIVLVESPTAPAPGRRAGLYHVALRYPDRAELAHLVRRLAEQRVPVQGLSDHGTHEAIYLPDPDGNGLELETDRPRPDWPTMAEEFSQGGPQPLDVEHLLEAAGSEPTRERSAGVDMGHLHLHVASTAEAEAFYRDVVGFSLIAGLSSAIFMSAGGYHHHVGANTWQGVGAPAVRPDALGLRQWTVIVPESGDLDALTERIERAQSEPALAPIRSRVDDDGSVVLADPSGNVVVVQTEVQRAAEEPARTRLTPAA